MPTDKNNTPTHQSSIQEHSLGKGSKMRRGKKIYAIPQITIHYKRWLEFEKMPVIRTSDDAYQIFLKVWNISQMDYVEQAYILLLNRANRVLGVSNISKGGTHATIIDRKIIFGTALKAHASGIVIAHGHPSGNLQPSSSDIETTEQIKAAGAILEITVLDHLIITSESYFSFADEEML